MPVQTYVGVPGIVIDVRTTNDLFEALDAIHTQVCDNFAESEMAPYPRSSRVGDGARRALRKCEDPMTRCILIVAPGASCEVVTASCTCGNWRAGRDVTRVEARRLHDAHIAVATRHCLTTDEVGGHVLSASCTCGWSIPVSFPTFRSMTPDEARIRHGSHADEAMCDAADAADQTIPRTVAARYE